ncbi:hypothetical protein, partial [Streptosporangium roseum]|uniref:hypothetical protein n=1 Tax=Streptosporangium roseum TaxID=2001 RepID=UPI00332FDC3D
AARPPPAADVGAGPDHDSVTVTVAAGRAAVEGFLPPDVSAVRALRRPNFASAALLVREDHPGGTPVPARG